jgi:hypothetical protein
MLIANVMRYSSLVRKLELYHSSSDGQTCLVAIAMSISIHTDFFTAPNDHTIASNRSHAYASVKKYHEALADAEKAIKLRPDWPKVRKITTII